MEGTIHFSLDIALFGLICLILFIYVISYWFQLKYREVKIAEPFCPNMKCDINLINNRLKNLAINIDFLSNRINEINKIMPFNNFQKQIEGFDGMYSNLADLEKRIGTIQKKQDSIFKYFQKRNPKYKQNTKKRNDIECYQIKSSEDCENSGLNIQLKMYKNKIDEIDYQTTLYSSIIEQINKSDAEYEKAKDQAINKSSKIANKQMSSLIGSKVNIDLNDHLKNGVSQTLSKAINTGDNRKIQESILNDPDAQRFAADVKPDQFTKNAQKIYQTEGPNAGDGYKAIGNDLISSRLSQSDRPDAQADFRNELRNQNAPSFIG